MLEILIGAVLSAVIFSSAIYIVFLIRQNSRFKLQAEHADKTMKASKRIYQIILENLDFQTVVQKVADTIPNELQFGTGVVAVLDEKKKVIRRIAASKTPEARSAIQALSLPF